MDIRSYSVDELQTIAQDVGEVRGWDFSRMSTERDPVPWDYLDVVARYLRPTDTVLDIGTGGGERLLDLSGKCRNAVGVDPDPEMVRVARINAENTTNVQFEVASAEQLAPLGDRTFDVVLTRQAPIHVPELDRYTKPGGYFISQGIGARNMDNIRQAFNTGSGTRYADEHRARLTEFSQRGWRLVASGEFDVRYWVRDVPSLIFWFKAIAGTNEVPDDFDVATHRDVVNTLIRRFGTVRGLATNEHRTLVVLQKPDE
jgi:SAM-dependent methyltransferase